MEKLVLRKTNKTPDTTEEVELSIEKIKDILTLVSPHYINENCCIEKIAEGREYHYLDFFFGPELSQGKPLDLLIPLVNNVNTRINKYNNIPWYKRIFSKI